MDKNEKKNDINKKIELPVFIFGKEMDDQTFLNLFYSIIKDIKDKKPTNCGKIYSFFEKIGTNCLYSILNANDMVTKLKKDIIIETLIENGLLNSKTDFDSEDIANIVRAIDDEEFSIKALDLNFKEIALSNGEKIELNKDLIIQFLKSESVMSAVKATLSQFEDKSINSAEKKVLEEQTENYIKKTKFYSINNISDNILAFTIHNGNIFINEKYINIIEQNNKKAPSSLAIILTTLYHEFIHYIIRTIFDQNNSNNYYLKTKQRTKNSKTKKMHESGEFFDKLLIGEYTGFFSIQAEFLLNINNYNENYLKFHENYTNYFSNNFEKRDIENFFRKKESRIVFIKGKMLFFLYKAK